MATLRIVGAQHAIVHSPPAYCQPRPIKYSSYPLLFSSRQEIIILLGSSNEFSERKKETFNLEAEGGGRKKSLQKGKKKFLHRVINNDILETTTVESNQGPKESKRRGSTRYSRVVTFRSLAGTMNTCGGRGVGATTMIRPPLGKLHHYESRTDSFAAPRHEPLRPRSWNNWIAGVQYVSRGN